MSSLQDLSTLVTVAVGLFTILSGGALWWLAKTFPTRRELEAVVKRQEVVERRLGQGDDRFTELEATVREATHAAEEAKRAAERAVAAAQEIGDARLEVAELKGEIKALNMLLQRLERDNARMVDGHLALKG